MNGPFAIFKWEAVFRDFSIFFEGFITTLEVAILGLALALALGIIFGMFSTSKIKVFKIISRIYVEIIQNTPLVIQVFFLFNGLPYLKIVLPVFLIGILGVGVWKKGCQVGSLTRPSIRKLTEALG